MKRLLFTSVIVSLALAGTTFAILDGQSIPSEGLTLRSTQDTPTGFGNSSGSQASTNGSELNQLFGDIVGGNLVFGITGNLEGSFNKFWIFFDGISGGENTLLNDNVDGGFDEIQNMAGLSFGPGFTADRGLRLQIGDGFYGVTAFNLIDNTAGLVISGGGPGDLPLANIVGGFGVSLGWDNSNVLGVDGDSAAGAATATTGFEFSIDLATFFGTVPSSVKVAAFISNGAGDFVSNQVLPGIGGGGNLGPPSGKTIGFVTIPEPATALLFGLGAILSVSRRSRR